jgi:acetolactate synthase regulatory subunit
MSELFIELYNDEDVSVLIAELIKARGFSVLTTHDAENLGKSDAEQLQFAVENKRVLLTHNRVDFEKLATEYFDEGKTHYGMIMAIRRLPNETLQRLLEVLNHTTAEEMINQIRYI